MCCSVLLQPFLKSGNTSPQLDESKLWAVLCWLPGTLFLSTFGAGVQELVPGQGPSTLLPTSLAALAADGLFPLDGVHHPGRALWILEGLCSNHCLCILPFLPHPTPPRLPFAPWTNDQKETHMQGGWGSSGLRYLFS